MRVSSRDANGCIVRCTFLIGAPEAPSCDISFHSDVTCNGGNDGTITVSGIGGSGNLEYSLNGGGFVTTSLFTGLTAGNYTVVVRTVNDPNCNSTCNVTIEEPNPLTGYL